MAGVILEEIRLIIHAGQADLLEDPSQAQLLHGRQRRQQGIVGKGHHHLLAAHPGPKTPTVYPRTT